MGAKYGVLVGCWDGGLGVVYSMDGMEKGKAAMDAILKLFGAEL